MTNLGLFRRIGFSPPGLFSGSVRANNWAAQISSARNSLSSTISLILRPVQFLAYFLVGLVPRDPNWWIFGSWSGHRASDSPRALIQHVAERPEDGVRATWITADREIARRLSQQGLDARQRWSIAGIWAAVRGGVYLYDGLTRDINHWLSRGATTIQLRHGVGPKRIERAIQTPSHRLYRLFHGSLVQRLFWSLVIPWHLVRPTMAIASSEVHAGSASEAFGLPDSGVVVTGLPRHDVLFSDDARPYLSDEEGAAIARLDEDPRPTFLFLPTFRDLDGSEGIDWDRLNETARGADVSVHIKLHIVDENRGTVTAKNIDGRSNLVWIPPSADPMPLYSHATGLITDISSVAFDMMLLERPIIYFIPDFEHLLEGRTLYFDFDEVSPGPKCRTYESLGEAMRGAADGSLGEFEQEYVALARRFHAFRDGQNSRRVFDAVRRLTALPTDPESS